MIMDNTLSYSAIMAWTAFGMQNYSALSQHSDYIYNYFVHKPSELLNIDKPLLIGKIFQACLGFQEPDQDIQEVRAENAFLCLSRALKSDIQTVHDEAAARLIMLLIQWQKYLINKVEEAYRDDTNPFKFHAILNGEYPKDMPVSTNTKMLFTAYYLFNQIIDKTNVNNEFIIPIEKQAFESVKKFILESCNIPDGIPQRRKIELGKIVFDKISKQLIHDIKLYSNSLIKP